MIGLAATASAAEVLAADLAAPTDTIAKLVQLAEPPTGAAAGRPGAMIPRANGSTPSTETPC